MAKIALIDDHKLLRAGLKSLIVDLGHQVVAEASNGKEFIDLMKHLDPPEIVLLDINMPQMDGHETARWLKENFPEIKVLALSMYDEEQTILRILRNGARGYIMKDCDPVELKSAIQSLTLKGYYHSELVSLRLIKSLNNSDNKNSNDDGRLELSEKEVKFLKLVCTEMTYKEIADVMHVSPRTVDGYREDLFEKLNTKSRIGLVVYSFRAGIVKA